MANDVRQHERGRSELVASADDHNLVDDLVAGFYEPRWWRIDFPIGGKRSSVDGLSIAGAHKRLDVFLGGGPLGTNDGKVHGVSTFAALILHVIA